MGELFRSQPMLLMQFFINMEAAKETVDCLGEIGMVQFKDLNRHQSPFQRTFYGQVKNIEELERKLHYLMARIHAYNKLAEEQGKTTLALTPEYQLGHELGLGHFDLLIDKIYQELVQWTQSQSVLFNTQLELHVAHHVLKNQAEFWPPDVELELNRQVKLNYLTGYVDKERIALLERVLFRLTQGNLLVISRPIPAICSPEGQLVEKAAFIVFFQGKTLEPRIRSLCMTLHVSLYHFPESRHERQELASKVESNQQVLSVVLSKGLTHCHSLLTQVSWHIMSWQHALKREKSIYHTMNMFSYDVGHKCLMAEGWIPAASVQSVDLALRRGVERSGSTVPSILSEIPIKGAPPTWFNLNKVTATFQGIVDTYGVPRYREINPAVFTIVTFPFMFGLMFGDVGHGSLLLIFAIYLLCQEGRIADPPRPTKAALSSNLMQIYINERPEWAQVVEATAVPTAVTAAAAAVGGVRSHPKSPPEDPPNEFIQMAFSGRYLILFMSLFSIYCGFIYNEIFSVPFAFIPSAWSINAKGDYVPSLTRTFEFGIDWVWKGNPFELQYYNSLKMKLSIIIGVLHMLLGLALKVMNGLDAGDYIEIFLETVPQIVFFCCLFGYLAVLIIIKWCYPFYANEVSNVVGGATRINAPPILTVMIYMFLNPFSKPPTQVPGTPLGESWALYQGQVVVQFLLLLLAMLSLPVMLLGKPLYKRYVLRPNTMMGEQPLVQDEAHGPDGDSDDHGGYDDEPPGHGVHDGPLSVQLIMQTIETIEFALNSLSNTASYLRLWALSLAHSELATVFWSLGLIGLGLSATPFPIPILVWAVFCAMSAGVLMILESISSFLHALRLHWVEYQNKFFRGDGYTFTPFSYALIRAEGDEAARIAAQKV